MEANFNGKTRAVNKKNYERFLKHNGINANKENIRDFVDFNSTMRGSNSDWSHNGHMRNHLTNTKSYKLFKKLVYAMHAPNINQAQKLAGKGQISKVNFGIEITVMAFLLIRSTQLFPNVLFFNLPQQDTIPSYSLLEMGILGLHSF